MSAPKQAVASSNELDRVEIQWSGQAVIKLVVRLADSKSLNASIKQKGSDQGWIQLQPHIKIKKGDRVAIHRGARLRYQAPRNGKNLKVGFDAKDRIPADIVFIIVKRLGFFSSTEIDRTMEDMEYKFLKRGSSSSPTCDPDSIYRRYAGSRGIDTTTLTKVLVEAAGGVLRRSTPEYPRGLVVFSSRPELVVDLYRLGNGRRVSAEAVRDLWEDTLGLSEGKFAVAMMVQSVELQGCKKVLS